LGGKLTEGGSQRASGGRSWTGGKGGVKWCSWRACEGGREGAQRGGRRRRCLLSVRRVAGEGGGSEAESTWKRETDRERGGASAAAGNVSWPTKMDGWHVHARGAARDRR
jgi:hypothetical protein